ncbi:MAG: hypothetical protein C0609_10280 [Deltaproteobacteria bacterium]|nr:MAG: hypothetical protein C0609_10280 [Deltaproteobacteria bacterium]
MGEWAATGTCPNCGGEVDTKVGDQLLDCRFCKSSMYVLPDGPLSYRMPADRAYSNESIFHLPYWRLRGVRYKVLKGGSKVVGGLVDLTAPACEHLNSGASLGIRPQAGRLHLTSWPPGTPGASLSPARIVDETGIDRLYNEHEDILFSRLIGEERVIIHAPFFLKNEGGRTLLMEAFPDGRPHSISESEADKLKAAIAGAPPPKELRFLTLGCPNCGHSLPPEHNAKVLLCEHCHRAFWPKGETFARMPYAIMGEIKESSRLFPFWHIDVEDKELGITSRADLLRWCAPFKVPRSKWEEEPASFLIPAFKVNARVFLRLAKTATIFFAGEEHRVRPGRGRLTSEPVRLPLSEAMEAVQVALCEMTTDKERRVPRIAAAAIKGVRARLLFIPFEPTGREYLHKESGQAIDLRAIEVGATL